ncbi:hypothetical protein FNV62_06720 [Streptomyces sp. RLB3-17]|uniref:hypothetical protein n=1 Tax=Streptomyces sp. RLB3-17 TaxID=2594455 RepID=UPI001163BDF8|nr:hypothetical protein [Streptomyces sp. RLB3-17]QDO37903.1 hypothetical protein FNV62_06720 [Streptomyces sp. RLB3-17]
MRGPERAYEPAGSEYRVRFHHVPHGVQQFGAPADRQRLAVAKLGDDPYEPGSCSRCGQLMADPLQQTCRAPHKAPEQVASWDGAEFVDHYTDAAAELIAAKREDREPLKAPERPLATEREAPAGRVVDLMAALHESVAKARSSRGEASDEGGTVHGMPTKKATAKKTTKKRSAKTAASKNAARKKAVTKKPPRFV